jgi:hypothetical protein
VTDADERLREEHDDDLRVRVGVTHVLTTYQYLADTGKVERLAHRRVITEGFAPGSRLAASSNGGL